MTVHIIFLHCCNFNFKIICMHAHSYVIWLYSKQKSGYYFLINASVHSTVCLKLMERSFGFCNDTGI